MSKTPGSVPRRGESIEVELDAIDRHGAFTGKAGAFRATLQATHRAGARPGVPGSRVMARVLRARRGRLLVAPQVELAPSPSRAEPRCAHFGICGGCSLQDLAYPAQLEAKRDLVERLLQGAPRGNGVRVEPPVPCESTYGYRNKMDFTFGSRRFVLPDEPPGAPVDFALGLHARGFHSKVLSIESCPIQHGSADAVLRTASALAAGMGLSGWDQRERKGLLRHLVLRRSETSGGLLAYLVTSEGEAERIELFAAELARIHPELESIVHGVTSRTSLVALGERERVLRGPGTLSEEILGLSLRISAEAFFQTNTRQARKLCEMVLEEASPQREMTFFDLYCGGGMFALLLARRCRAVCAFELSESGLCDARENARANGLDNVRFIAGDLAQTLAEEGRPALAGRPLDACVVDPPRAGLHRKVVSALAELSPRRIVYVSCNARALAEDLAQLASAGYLARRVRTIDMFPHTPHLECVATLEPSAGL